jgi:hypothetical protein
MVITSSLDEQLWLLVREEREKLILQGITRFGRHRILIFIVVQSTMRAW